MPSNKKSFILHHDSLSVLDELTDEEAGKLFKAIKAHHLNEEIELDSIIRIVFSPFKNQFIRDLEKYTNTCAARAVAGSSGGKKKAANVAKASKSKQKVANVADSVSDNDSESVNESDNKREVIPYQQIADSYNTNFAVPSLNPEVAKLNSERKRLIKILWLTCTDSDDETKLTNNLEYWARYFDHCSGIKFLRGDTERADSFKTWRPDINYVMKEKTYIQVLEGTL